MLLLVSRSIPVLMMSQCISCCALGLERSLDISKVLLALHLRHFLAKLQYLRPVVMISDVARSVSIVDT